MPKARATAEAVERYEPRSAKGTLTRAKLLHAAKLIFERDGMLNGRITDISKRARVSYGAFYHYFGSKEELFREVAEAQEERLTAPPDEPDPPNPSETAEDRIRAANRRYLERYREEAALMGKIEQASRYDPHVNSVRVASQRHFAERSDRAIKRLQAEGNADPRVNPAIAADALGAMVGRFAELWLTQGYKEYDFDEVVEQLTILWANAIGIKPPAAPTKPRSRAR